MDMPHMRSDGVRAAAEHALHRTRWACNGAYLQWPRLEHRAHGPPPAPLVAGHFHANQCTTDTPLL